VPYLHRLSRTRLLQDKYRARLIKTVGQNNKNKDNTDHEDHRSTSSILSLESYLRPRVEKCGWK
jgi:hypothetical protein